MENDIMDVIFGAEGVEMEPEKFQVTSLQSASWCMAKASAAVNKIKQAEAMKAEAHYRIDKWFDEYTADPTKAIELMKEFLRPWVEEETADQKSKSVKLPNGVAGFRTSPVSVQITNDEAIVAEAEELMIPVQVKKLVRKRDIKDYITSTGRVLDNAVLTPGTERFYVKIEGEE